MRSSTTATSSGGRGRNQWPSIARSRSTRFDSSASKSYIHRELSDLVYLKDGLENVIVDFNEGRFVDTDKVRMVVELFEAPMEKKDRLQTLET